VFYVYVEYKNKAILLLEILLSITSVIIYDIDINFVCVCVCVCVLKLQAILIVKFLIWKNTLFAREYFLHRRFAVATRGMHFAESVDLKGDTRAHTRRTDERLHSYSVH